MSRDARPYLDAESHEGQARCRYPLRPLTLLLALKFHNPQPPTPNRYPLSP
jgi:hypothetical protein